MAYPVATRPIMLSCISNEIGGDPISTSYWTGVRLPDLAKDLGLRLGVKALAISAADGFYESVSLDDMRDPRTLLVYGMNGQTLPIEPGYPPCPGSFTA
jgi:DMSO/TMAO reductase YedYZ molybdopterin-dependent catalytic subunit